LKTLNAFFSIFTNAHVTSGATEAFNCQRRVLVPRCSWIKNSESRLEPS